MATVPSAWGGVSLGWTAPGGRDFVFFVGWVIIVPECCSDLWLSGNKGGTWSRVNKLIGENRKGERRRWKTEVCCWFEAGRGGEGWKREPVVALYLPVRKRFRGAAARHLRFSEVEQKKTSDNRFMTPWHSRPHWGEWLKSRGKLYHHE